MIVLWLPILIILTSYVISADMSEEVKLSYYILIGVILALKLLFFMIGG